MAWKHWGSENVLFEVCLSLEIEQTQEARTQGLSDCLLETQTNCQFSGKKAKPARQTKHVAQWSVEQPVCGLSVTHCCSVGHGLQAPNRFIPPFRSLFINLRNLYAALTLCQLSG